jgi:hypothetical protein
MDTQARYITSHLRSQRQDRGQGGERRTKAGHALDQVSASPSRKGKWGNTFIFTGHLSATDSQLCSWSTKIATDTTQRDEQDCAQWTLIYKTLYPCHPKPVRHQPTKSPVILWELKFQLQADWVRSTQGDPQEFMNTRCVWNATLALKKSWFFFFWFWWMNPGAC